MRGGEIVDSTCTVVKCDTDVDGAHGVIYEIGSKDIVQCSSVIKNIELIETHRV